MYGIVSANTVVKLLEDFQAFETQGIQYPADWISKTSNVEQQAIGVYPVVFDNKPNEKYFTITSNTAFDSGNNRIFVTYSQNAKPLNTLKAIVINDTRNQAKVALNQTDWKVLRAVETNSNVSLVLSNVRANIRSAVNGFEANVAAAATVLQLAGVVTNFIFPSIIDDE
jgi:hypothetical protein